MKVVAIIQARMGSKRLPGKSLMQIAGKPLLWYVLERVKAAETLDAVILATSINPENDELCDLANESHVEIFRGSETDVLSRFVEAGKIAQADVIVRICADNPLIDPGEIDRIVRHHISEGCDYSFNHIPARDNNYPDGFGAEVVNAQLLYSLQEIELTPEDREHVTLYITRNSDKYSIRTLEAPYEIIGPDIKLDIDTEDDFTRMKSFIEHLPQEGKPLWSAAEIVRKYREFFKKKVIILIATRQDADFYCNLYTTSSSVYIPVVTSPYAEGEFENRGIPIQRVDRYFDSQEIYTLGMENYQKLEKICSLFDTILLKTDPWIEKFSFQLTRYNFFALKFQLDNLTMKTRILQKLITINKPDLIISFSNPEFDRREVVQNPAEIPPSLNYYSIILKHQGWSCKTAIFSLITNKSEENKTNTVYQKICLGSGIRAHIIRITDWIKLARSQRIITRAVQFFSKMNIGVRKKKCIIDLGFSYDWSSILYPLWEHGYYFHHMDQRSEPKQKRSDSLNSLFLVLKSELKQYCIVDSIDYSDLYYSTILSLLEKQICLIPGIVTSVEQEISLKKPLAFVSPPKTRVEEHIISRIFQYHHIPVISWQHGAYGHHSAPILFYTEYQNTDIHLNWGNGVLNAMRHDPLNKTPIKDIPVGSYQLQHLFKRNLPKKYKYSILYVTTGYFNNFFYISYPYPVHDNQLWSVQKDIIRILGNTQRNTVVKIHQSDDSKALFSDYLTSRSFQNVRIIKNEYTFNELLQQSEIVIIDFPSTVLLQSIAMHKVIFVLMKIITLNEDALRLLKKRVYYAQTTEELGMLINNYLNNIPLDQNPDINNTEFFEQYGISSINGSIEDRLIPILNNISDGNMMERN